MTFGAPHWFWALLACPVLARRSFVRAEQRAALRLREFVSERLLPNLARTVDRRRRELRFALVLLGLALALDRAGPTALGLHLRRREAQRDST